MHDRSVRYGAWFACIVLMICLPLAVCSSQPGSTSLNLAAFEKLAIQRNPTLLQAAANIEAAQGRAQQAGLYPNPTVGYTGELIGTSGTAGEMQGLFIDQTIVTAGKLRL